ncbi:inositol polyphosphate multikinase [Annulohypoxylon maeteangense]|uniref:inositol polyphosphate multikinase n=1 Tax=Annulohypoxylon maeteangense TaxID=1927788 RepID=UPI002008CE3D|nr:inositol polyphosphate multikinase [Annulohypoxylon maeteangense]KAI0889202.1 inositol polyphosphate multikinase [Annulohypoxylon maeteangense]
MLVSRDTIKNGGSKERELPKRDDLKDYNYAVAGHAGTMCDADGELFIKPCTQSEVEFYESAHALHPDFAELMPMYIGTLSLSNSTDQASIHAQIPNLVEHADIPFSMKEEIQSHLHLADRTPVAETPVQKQIKPDNDKWIPNKARKIATDQAVVLENASFGFKKPNIMDAKLGVRLWADDAPLEKKARFDKITKETTHKKFGFRVAGMRVYNGSTDESELDNEGFKIFDKDWGRYTVNEANIVDSFKKFIFNEAAGIDEELGKTVAGLFAEDLRRVQEVLENEESRMYSSSLLFVFEGDGEALRAAIEEWKADSTISAESKRGATRGPVSNLRVDSGIGMNEEDLVEPTALEDFDGLEDDSDEESSLPKIYSLRFIDFAHATWEPGQGPDENVLLGVKSLTKIFKDISES